MLRSGPQRKLIKTESTTVIFWNVVRYSGNSHALPVIVLHLSATSGSGGAGKCHVGSDETTRKEGASPWVWLTNASIITWKTKSFPSQKILWRIRSSPGLSKYSVSEARAVPLPVPSHAAELHSLKAKHLKHAVTQCVLLKQLIGIINFAKWKWRILWEEEKRDT